VNIAGRRVLALDVGDARIGLAISDPTGVIATPLPALTRRQPNDDAATVVRVAAEHDVGLIVVGLPLTLAGRRGPQARAVDAFRRLLAQVSPVPVTARDERLSTVEAARDLQAAGIQPSRDRARLDSAAAAVVLQSYLDSTALKRGLEKHGFERSQSH
jgi:putative Holliday junction resolvase